MRTHASALAFGLAALTTLTSASALAHISIADLGNADKNQVITFNVGHGCEGADTVSIEVMIPPEVTSVRGAANFFGYADVKTDETGAVTSVVWTKSDVRAQDDQFYQLQLRIKVPNLPFQTLYFPTIQHCRAEDGTEKTNEWIGTPTVEAEEPAPALKIVPGHSPGWNKLTAAEAVSDLSYFTDAQIVWVGDKAYSANATTAAMIEAEEDVSTLTEIAKDAEIWVKY